jgi:hypothetical protein
MSGVDRDKAVSFGGNQAATKRLLRNFLQKYYLLQRLGSEIDTKKALVGSAFFTSPSFCRLYPGSSFTLPDIMTQPWAAITRRSSGPLSPIFLFVA